MTFSPDARNIFDRLPEDGTKVGGITIQRDLEISKLVYMTARDELKEEGLVTVGGGRGGSLARVEGAEIPEEKTSSQAERLEHAREAKQAKSRAKKELDQKIEMVISYFDKEGVTVAREDVSFRDGQPIAAVWEKNGRKARMYAIREDLDWSKFQAEWRMTHKHA